MLCVCVFAIWFRCCWICSLACFPFDLSFGFCTRRVVAVTVLYCTVLLLEFWDFRILYSSLSVVCGPCSVTISANGNGMGIEGCLRKVRECCACAL